MKRKFILSIVAIIIVSMAYAQNTPWKNKGNSIGSSDYLGTNNNQPLIIKTNSQKRMKINSSGGVEVDDFLNVNGYIETDSLYVKGSLIVSDGEGSFYWDPNVNFGTCDRMRVSTGNFAIMGGFNFPPPWGWQVVTPLVNVGIGTQNAQSKLHLFTPIGNVFSQTTNNITGSAATDGFLVGINSDGIAELRQQEDKDIVFYTGNTEQMIISSENNIKINSLASNSKNYVIADENGTLMLYAIDINEIKISELETRIIELEQKIYKLEQLLALQ